MLTISRRKVQLLSCGMILVALVAGAHALLTQTRDTPGNLQIVGPFLIQVYKDSALTQNLTSVTWPRTMAFNGTLASNEALYIKNTDSKSVTVTLTVLNLPTGITCAPVSNTIVAGGVWSFGTVNLIVTPSVQYANYTPTVRLSVIGTP